MSPIHVQDGRFDRDALLATLAGLSSGDAALIVTFLAVRRAALDPV